MAGGSVESGRILWREDLARSYTMANLLIDAISFQVIGELKDDPGHLLLIGDDGSWYDFDIVQVTIKPIEPGDS